MSQLDAQAELQLEIHEVEEIIKRIEKETSNYHAFIGICNAGYDAEALQRTFMNLQVNSCAPILQIVHRDREIAHELTSALGATKIITLKNTEGHVLTIDKEMQAIQEALRTIRDISYDKLIVGCPVNASHPGGIDIASIKTSSPVPHQVEQLWAQMLQTKAQLKQNIEQLKARIQREKIQ